MNVSISGNCSAVAYRLLHVSVVSCVDATDLDEAPEEQEDDVDGRSSVVVDDRQSDELELLVPVDEHHHVDVDDVVVDVVVDQLLEEE